MATRADCCLARRAGLGGGGVGRAGPGPARHACDHGAAGDRAVPGVAGLVACATPPAGYPARTCGGEGGHRGQPLASPATPGIPAPAGRVHAERNCKRHPGHAGAVLRPRPVAGTTRPGAGLPRSVLCQCGHFIASVDARRAALRPRANLARRYRSGGRHLCLGRHAGRWGCLVVPDRLRPVWRSTRHGPGTARRAPGRRD